MGGVQRAGELAHVHEKGCAREMIQLDDRIGSKELRNLFRPFGIAVELKRMESGDMAFEG